MLDEIGETILPATASSPGAKASKIGEFMKVIVTDSYSSGEKKIFFLKGISVIDQAAKKKYDIPFIKLTNNQKLDTTLFFDQEA